MVPLGAGRFVGADEPQKWRDVAFCMAQLPCSERALKKLAENWKAYAHTLVDDEVAASFAVLCQRAKKAAGKPEATQRAAAEALEVTPHPGSLGELLEPQPQTRPRPDETTETEGSTKNYETSCCSSHAFCFH